MANNTVYESKEYDRLVRRGFKPYSLGHQKMYTKAIERIKLDRPDGASIFEAGFGIGWGLQQMRLAGVVNAYVGVEPNRDSFQYVAGTLGLDGIDDITLHNVPFDQMRADAILTERGGNKLFNEAFCIEVIEHVPMHLHLQFLIALRSMAPRLWFSSPDMAKSKEGVRTTKDWTALLKQAQYTSVSVDQSEWTYLYECKS